MSIFRTLAERLSRGLIIKRKIIVNRAKIPLFVTPDAQLKYLRPGKKAFDSDLILIAEKFLTEKSNVWDIGANVGVFTFAASAVAYKGSVLSIEADIWLAHIIQKSVRMGGYQRENISVLPVAVSDCNSVSSFIIAKRGRASNAIEEVGGRSQVGGIREKLYVPTLTLYTILSEFPSPEFIKIDVEGAERKVLDGASKIINEVRPSLYIEIGREMSKNLFLFFANHQYLAYDINGNLLTGNCTHNTLFIPEENHKFRAILE